VKKHGPCNVIPFVVIGGKYGVCGGNYQQIEQRVWR
jgi:hypothetical protein